MINHLPVITKENVNFLLQYFSRRAPPSGMTSADIPSSITKMNVSHKKADWPWRSTLLLYPFSYCEAKEEYGADCKVGGLLEYI